MKFHQSSKSRRLGVLVELAYWINFYGFKSEKPWIRAKEYERASRRRNRWGRISGCKLAQYRADPVIRRWAKDFVRLARTVLNKSEVRR